MLMEHADVTQTGWPQIDRCLWMPPTPFLWVQHSTQASHFKDGSFYHWGSPPYYNYPQPYPATPGSYEFFPAVGQSISVRVFWGLNSLAFCSSLATVVAGAGCVLPMPDTFIKRQVRVVHKALVMTSILLVMSIVFVLGRLQLLALHPCCPALEYTTYISVTTACGGVLCLSLLAWFVRRLYRIRPLWWRQMEEDMLFGKAGNKERIERDAYFIS